MLFTTLKLLRENSACSDGLFILIASLPEGQAEDTLISLDHILESNGLEHALWALRATTVDSRKLTARLALEFATPVLSVFEEHYPDDKRPRKALEDAAAFLEGRATLQELEKTSLSSWSSWSSVAGAVNGARAAYRAGEAVSWASLAAIRSGSDWMRGQASKMAINARWAATEAVRSLEIGQEEAFLKYIRTPD